MYGRVCGSLLWHNDSSAAFCFEVNWIELNWSEVKWSEVKWSEVKWSEVSHGEILGDKRTMYIRVTFYWVTGLYCDYFIWYVSCSVVVWTCFVMCGCSDNCGGVFVICVFVFTAFCIVCTVFLYCFVYSYLFYLYYCKDYCHRVKTQLQ